MSTNTTAATRTTFERALFLTIRGTEQRKKSEAGRKAAECLLGLTEEDVMTWGRDLGARLTEFERRYRGTQHLLQCDMPREEPLGFRSSLQGEAADIGSRLFEHREKLAQLANLHELFNTEYEDGSGFTHRIAAGLIGRNLRSLHEGLRARFPGGSDAKASCTFPKSGHAVLQLDFRTGRASRTYKQEFEADLSSGSLSERFQRIVGLWREIQVIAKKELTDTASWPTKEAMEQCEIDRAGYLVREWMRSLSVQDRATIQSHGAQALAAWR